MQAVFTFLLLSAVLIWIDIFCTVTRIVLSRKHLEPLLTFMSPRWSKSILSVMAVYGSVDIRLEQNPSLQLPEHCIVLANHQNLVDILALFVLLKQLPLRFVGKNTLRFGFPGVTSVMRFGRHIFIRQSGDPMGAVLAVKRFAKRIFRDKLSPVIFPEGTRSKDGVLREFKTGGMRTITEGAQLPFIAVAIDGGQTLKGMKSLHRRSKAYYRMKPVMVHPIINGKAEAGIMLSKIRATIDQQITLWRKELQ